MVDDGMPEPFLSQVLSDGGDHDLYRDASGRSAATRLLAVLAANLRCDEVARVRAGEPRDPRPAPGGEPEVRLPIRSPLIDRDKLIQLAEVHQGLRRHLDLAEEARPTSISGGKTLQGTVGEQFILLRQHAKGLRRPR